MSDIVDLEAQIIERLMRALTIAGQTHPKVDVDAWPDDPRSYKMVHPRGVVLVMYRGVRYEDSTLAGHVANGEQQFELGVISKTLRSPAVALASDEPDTCAYTLLRQCREAVAGWRADGASNIARVKKVEFEGYMEGTWNYSMRIEIPTLTVVERLDAFEIEISSSLTAIDYQEQTT